MSKGARLHVDLHLISIILITIHLCRWNVKRRASIRGEWIGWLVDEMYKFVRNAWARMVCCEQSAQEKEKKSNRFLVLFARVFHFSHRIQSLFMEMKNAETKSDWEWDGDSEVVYEKLVVRLTCNQLTAVRKRDRLGKTQRWMTWMMCMKLAWEQ